MQIFRRLLIRPYLYIFIALIGVSLKFYHLDYKLFWFDEVCTIQHTSGIPDRDYPALIPINEVINIDFYNDLYHLNKQDYTIGSELKGLLSATQLNPLHYPFLMVWYRIVGDNPVDFVVFMQECTSDNIDILRVSPGVDSVENRINHNEYSDIYVLYASNELVENLKLQFGKKIDSLNIESTSSIWKININDFQ